MDNNEKITPWKGATMALALVCALSACGTEEEAATAGTSTERSGLSENVAYLPWGALTAKSNTAVDATVFNGKAYFAYIRPDSNIGMIVESSLGWNGQSPTSYSIPQPSQDGPALLALNGTLYLFTIAPGGVWLYMQTSTDGLNWAGPYPIDIYTNYVWDAPPVAVAWNGQPLVYVPTKDGNGAPRIVQWNISGTGGTSSLLPYGYGTYNRPSATIWNNSLYLAWVDPNQGNQVGMMHYTSGVGWSAETLTGKYGVATIAPVLNGLEMINRGGDSHIYRTYSTDGVSWGASYQDLYSYTNHAAVPFEQLNGSDYWVFYVGLDNKLYTADE
jgi:hypothetical protein